MEWAGIRCIGKLKGHWIRGIRNLAGPGNGSIGFLKAHGTGDYGDMKGLGMRIMLQETRYTYICYYTSNIAFSPSSVTD